VPVITLFEYEPDIDAKVSKILGLEDDLALALQALSVRIIAPIPGTALVGFEVANEERSNVFLRDIIRADLFAKSKATLPIVLGKDTSGSDVIVDLLDMPHLLVAGSTGSGNQ
jgi:S-DNA-T family DNA segregation ATPase FtsK/SpoIIIE